MSRRGAGTGSARPRRRPVTVRLPEARWAQLRELAASRGLSLSELLGVGASLVIFDARLSALCLTLEQADATAEPPPGKA